MPQAYTYDDFLRDHEAALRCMRVPELYWPSVHTKLLGKVFDAEQKLELGLLKYTRAGKEDTEVVDKELFVSVKVDEIRADDPDSVFLADHAWTFELKDVRATLESNSILLPRMKTLMCVDETDTNAAIEAVMRKMWKFCRLYQLSEPPKEGEDGEEIVLKRDVWYILDEFGSALQQSTTPNVRVASLVYVPEQLCYSVFWPIHDLHNDDTLTVDWMAAESDPERKALLLIPWEGGDFSEGSSAHSYILTEEFFLSHRIAETLPHPDAKLVMAKEVPQLVYTDMNLVARTLTSPNYTLTNNRDDAGIIWTRQHIKNYEWMSKNRGDVWLNQFPYESVLTVKDLLAALACSERGIAISGPGEGVDVDGKRPLTCSWYPVTFNLFYELGQFVAFFQRREAECEEETVGEVSKECLEPKKCLRCDDQGKHVSYEFDGQKRNIWIVKPWNLGRGLGICISDNLNQILRLTESGPMIASRYITDPVLFYREDITSWVKFDVRYVVLLKSVRPLRLFAHKVFWLRFANKPFSLDHFDDYAKHFTVMNYRDNDELCQVHHTDFIAAFEMQYPNAKWSEIEKRIFRALVQVFLTASAQPPPRGIGPYAKSRALYAVDLLLEWKKTENCKDSSQSCGFSVVPQICEVNFIPDCTRACLYYPDFHNEVFDFLFLDKESPNIVRLA